MTAEPVLLSPEMLAKAFLYAALLASLGACAVRGLLVPRLARAGADADAAGLAESAARVLLVAATVTVAALLGRAWTHTMAAFGFADALVWENVRIIAFESRWGEGWSRQALAGATTLVLSVGVRAGWTRLWPLATLAVVGLSVTIPLIGHAAGDLMRQSIHVVHLLAGGLWIGTLVVLFVDLTRREGSARAFSLFSPLALTGASVIVLSGLGAAALYVGPPAHLVTTAYGRTLAVKIVLFLIVASFGYLNWRRVRHVAAAPVPVSGDALARTVAVELTMATAVVLITGVLTELAHP